MYSDASEVIPMLSNIDAQKLITHVTSQMHSNASQAILTLSSTYMLIGNNFCSLEMTSAHWK
jgi:hypothetical protein